MARARATAFCFSACSSSVMARVSWAFSSSRAAAAGSIASAVEGPVGQDGDHVVADLGEAAVDVVAVDRVADPGAQLAVAEPADQRERPGRTPSSPS